MKKQKQIIGTISLLLLTLSMLSLGGNANNAKEVRFSLGLKYIGDRKYAITDINFISSQRRDQPAGFSRPIDTSCAADNYCGPYSDDPLYSLL